MKKTIFLLVMLFLFGAGQGYPADRCSDTWTEADARAIMPGLEYYSGYAWGEGPTVWDLVDTTGLKVWELMTPDTCYAETCGRWRVDIVVRIFPSARKAVVYFETRKGEFLSEEPAPFVFENSASRFSGTDACDHYDWLEGGDLTGRIEDPVESFKLFGKHNNAVIEISGHGGSLYWTDVSAAIMNGIFVDYYDRAALVVDEKRGTRLRSRPFSKRSALTSNA